MTFKDTLKEDWKQAWKWFSTQLGVIIAVSPEVYNQIIEMHLIDQQAAAPVFRHGMAILGVLVILNSIRKKNGAAKETS